MAKANRFSSRLWSVVMTLICVLWMYPIFMALMISLKQPTAISTATAFELPNADTFAGFVNYENAINQQGFFSSLFYSVLITVTSVFAILIFCSMFAWYITRVHTRFTKLLYGLCAFSMVVPFQMVMFTLSKTADQLNLNTPWNICIIYLGFGAGLAVFMFTGFMKSVPMEIEEAAMIDGCSEMKAMWKVMIPMASPGIITVTIFNFMNIWNEYFMALIFANGNDKIRTLSMGLQNMITSMKYTGDWAGLFAGVIIVLVPTLILYLLLSEKIVAGITGGAVKG